MKKQENQTQTESDQKLNTNPVPTRTYHGFSQKPRKLVRSQRVSLYSSVNPDESIGFNTANTADHTDEPEKTEKKKALGPAGWILIGLSLLLVIFNIYLWNQIISSNSENDRLAGEVSGLNDELDALIDENISLSTELDQATNSAQAKLDQLIVAFINQDYQDVVDLYNEIHNKDNGSTYDQQAYPYFIEASQILADQKLQTSLQNTTQIDYQMLSNPDSNLLFQNVSLGGMIKSVFADETLSIASLNLYGNADEVVILSFDQEISDLITSGSWIFLNGTYYGDFSSSINGEQIQGPLIRVSDYWAA